MIALAACAAAAAWLHLRDSQRYAANVPEAASIAAPQGKGPLAPRTEPRQHEPRASTSTARETPVEYFARVANRVSRAAVGSAEHEEALRELGVAFQTLENLDEDQRREVARSWQRAAENLPSTR